MPTNHARHSHDTPEVTDALWGEWLAQLTAELAGTDDEWELAEFRDDPTALPALFMTARAYAEWFAEWTESNALARQDDAYRNRVAWGIA